MKGKRLAGLGWSTGIAVGVLTAMMISGVNHVNADDDDHDHDRVEDARIKKGFEIAPVHLKVDGRDWKAVGLGSYLVNGAMGCDDCHSAGPQTQYLPGDNPFFGQREKTNPETYLGGGRDFGKLEGPDSPDIISRNLTPDKTGKPAGGRSFEEFRTIMRVGKDYDHLHPNCSATITTNCLTPPFDGALLQVMPWPDFKAMTDHDLWAIYQYLSAVPCIAGPEDPSNPLHNDCE